MLLSNCSIVVKAQWMREKGRCKRRPLHGLSLAALMVHHHLHYNADLFYPVPCPLRDSRRLTESRYSRYIFNIYIKDHQDKSCVVCHGRRQVGHFQIISGDSSLQLFDIQLYVHFINRDLYGRDSIT